MVVGQHGSQDILFRSSGEHQPMSEVLAVVPARGGSKSIPHKNIRAFGSYPLIAYSICAGLTSEFVTRLIVTTDDEEIAAISRKYGAETPFIRPASLAEDLTPDLPVFIHTLQWLVDQENYHPDIVVQLRPTSPLRRVWHIDAAIQRLFEHPEADSVRTVCIPFQNPYKMWKIRGNGTLQALMETEFSEPYNMPRQLLPEVFWQTGYVDAVYSDTIVEKESMTGDVILPLVIPASDWIDIDSMDDWRRGERLLESKEISFEDLGFQIAETN
jgi:CMP-N-acetylneuraminic acid synthetase